MAVPGFAIQDSRGLALKRGKLGVGLNPAWPKTAAGKQQWGLFVPGIAPGIAQILPEKIASYRSNLIP
jgi:hypothetical protein